MEGKKEERYTYQGIELPRYTKESLDRYASEGITTGGFLRAVLANDLMESVGRADCTNLPAIPVIAVYIYNRLPSACHGSYDKIDNWIKEKRG